jgi:hypothetical protein
MRIRGPIIGVGGRRTGGRAGASLASRLTTLLGPDASFWLPGPEWFFTDAAKTVPCTDTDTIRVWADGSANGRDLTQANSAWRPTARFIDGKWRAVFDGVDDALSLPSWLDQGPAWGDVTVYAAAEVTTAFSYHPLLNAGGAQPLFGVFGGYVIGSYWTGSSDTQINGNVTLEEGAFHTLGFERWGGEFMNMYIDGVADGDVRTQDGSFASNVTVGGRPETTQVWEGGINALVIAKSAITSGQRSALVSLLSEVMP